VLDLRVRSRLSDEAMRQREGKLPGPRDYDALLTGAARVAKPDGSPLCVLLPGAVTEQMDAPGVYDVLHSLRTQISVNRGKASGTPRFKSGQSRSYTRKLRSAIIGAVDPIGQTKYCRLTSWTGKNLPQWQALHPLLQAVAAALAEHVPARYSAQLRRAESTHPAWVVPGTPFTTVTVNNSFATGCHTDKGDLDEGFSTICVIRRGSYTGGQLVFPQYRLAADLGHGDLILMDAHEWHGNVQLVCACGMPVNGGCDDCGMERISVVAYFRTRLTGCGSPDEELRRADEFHDRVAAERAARGAGGAPPAP
jgi:hypothetical protein